MRNQSFLNVGSAHVTTKYVCRADRLQTSFVFLAVIMHDSDGYPGAFRALDLRVGCCRVLFFCGTVQWKSFPYFNGADKCIKMKATAKQVPLYIGKTAPSAVEARSSFCFQWRSKGIEKNVFPYSEPAISHTAATTQCHPTQWWCYSELWNCCWLFHDIFTENKKETFNNIWGKGSLSEVLDTWQKV